MSSVAPSPEQRKKPPEPASTRMTTPVERTKTIEVRGSGAAFKSSDNGAQIHSGRVAEKEMGAVGFAAKLNPCCRPSRSPSRKGLEAREGQRESFDGTSCRRQQA